MAIQLHHQAIFRLALKPAFRLLGSYGINGLDADIATDVALRTQHAIRQYAEQCFPDVVGSLELTTSDYEAIQAELGMLDIEQGVDNILQKLRGQYEAGDLSHIHHTAAGLLGAISLNDAVLGNGIKRLVDAGQARGASEEGSAQYIMAHTTPQVFGTYVDDKNGSISVIKIGGPSEKPFTGTQRAVAGFTPAKKIGSIARTHFNGDTQGPAQLHFVSKSDSLPPYYAPKGGRTINDMTLGPNGKFVSFEGKPDADTLMAINTAGGKDELQDFMTQVRNG